MLGQLSFMICARQGCWSRRHIFAAILQPSPFCHPAAPQLGNVYICMSRPLTTKDMNDRHASTCKAIGLKNALPGAKSWQHASLSKLDVSELRGMFCPFSSSCTGRFTFLKLLGNVKSRLLSGEETLHSLRKDLVHACTRMHLLANMHPVHLSTIYLELQLCTAPFVKGSDILKSDKHNAQCCWYTSKFRAGPLITHYTYVYSTRTRLNLSVLIRMHDPQQEYASRAIF